MMKRHLISIAVAALACALLLAGVALAQNGHSDSTLIADAVPRPAFYTVGQGTASGGGYNLTGLAWQVEGVASGGGYRLLDPLSLNASPPPSVQVGCCCTYLPCTLRTVP